MTNDRFNKLMIKLHNANIKYKELLVKAEQEFEKRYGKKPSDIDFDSWIDCYHYGPNFISAEEIDALFKEFHGNEKTK